MNLPIVVIPATTAPPYLPIPGSEWRVKLAFRIDFTNGGHVQGEGFLLDLTNDSVSPERAAEMLVSAMNLLRAGPVTVSDLQVVRRGEHDDFAAHHRTLHK